MVKVGDSGIVRYTGRAFNQDAQEAMGGDIVRGLIELVTNADDAYAEAQADLGKILLDIDRSRGRDWTAAVKDRAGGLTASELVTNFATLGSRTSGFERGEARRGNLGRGAKDVAAFGEVTFESIKGDRYARLLLHADGSWLLEEDHRATSEERMSLGVTRGTGTVVTIRVKAGTKCPLRQTLKSKLSAHFQLRDILSDPARRVELHTANTGSTDLLAYEYPAREVVSEGEINIDGYPAATAHLTICRNSERYDDGRDDPTRVSGILIKGQRAIYDNTLFSFEGNPYAGWFSGTLVCPYIDTLARQYDDRPGEGPVDPQNPLPIISRRRDGLAPSHPFVKALRLAVEGPLGRLVAEEEDRARREGSRLEDAQARAALDRLSREISTLINDELREIEAEEAGDADTGVVPALAIIPDVAYAYLGEDRTLTVQARQDVAAPTDALEITLDPGGVLELLTPVVSLAQHPRRSDLLSGQIRLRPLLDDSSTLVTASMENHSADAIVTVRGSALVAETDVQPPETLEFQRANYRISIHRERSIYLGAPAEIVAAHGPTVSITSNHAGVVLRASTATLALDEDLGYYRAPIRVEGRVLGITATLTAAVGDVVASTHITVGRKEEGFQVRIRLVDEEMGVYRAVFADETDESGGQYRVIKVSGRHPALRSLLSEHGPNSRESRLVIAESVADAAARLVVNQLYRLRRGSEEFTSERLYLEHYRRATRFVPRAQKSLLSDLESGPGRSALEIVPG